MTGKICWPERFFLWWGLGLMMSVAGGLIFGVLRKPPADLGKGYVSARIRFSGQSDAQPADAEICIASSMEEVQKQGGWRKFPNKFSTDAAGKQGKLLLGGHTVSLLVWPRRAAKGQSEYEGDPFPVSVRWPEASEENKTISVEISRERARAEWHPLP